MIVMGLTGSIGMGKSTTAGFFREAGIPVHDADAAVHQLYAGPLAPLIEQEFPGSTDHGKVDRARLRDVIAGDPSAVERLEKIVHPEVRSLETAFRLKALSRGIRLVVLDIPLLFEKTAAERCDMIVVVTADADVQRSRVLARPGMTGELFEALLARQISDAEKRRRSHFLVDTGHGLESARRQVQAILRAIAAC